MDLATLGIAVDSTGVVKASTALDNLTASAKKTEVATVAVGKATNNSMRMAMQQLSQVAQQGSATGNYLQALAIQLPDLALGFGTVGIAAGAVAGALLSYFSTGGKTADFMKDANERAKQFEATLSRIKDVAPAVGAAIEKALTGDKGAGNAAAELAQGARDFKAQYTEAFQTVRGQLEAFKTEGAKANFLLSADPIHQVTTALAEMGDQLGSNKITAQQALEQLNAMSSASTTPESLYTTIDALRLVIKGAVDAQAALSKLSGQQGKGARPGVSDQQVVDERNKGTLLARMGIGEDPTKITKALQDQAKALHEVHKAAAGAAKEDPYQKINEGADRRIASLETERAALGMTEEAANSMKYAQDMLNQADQANIKLSPQQIAQLNAKAAAMAHLEEQVKQYNENAALAKDATTGFLSTLREGLVSGEGMWKSFGNAALSVLDKIAGAIESQIAEQLVGKGLGGIFGSLLGGGGFNPAGKVGLFANGTNYAPGGMAVVGEQGPELVNLPRGAQVIPNHRMGGAGGQSVQVSVGVSVDNEGAIKAYVKDTVVKTGGPMMKAGLDHFSSNILPDRMNQISKDPRKRGR